MRWNGEQARAASRTTALRIEAARADSLADSQTEIDVATFIQWVDATAHDDEELTDFYEERFRPEFAVAFDAWIATEPLTTPGAPLSPFAMDEYQTSAAAETARLDQQSAAESLVVGRNIQRASNYVLAVVLMSVSLFFAGISTKLHTPAIADDHPRNRLHRVRVHSGLDGDVPGQPLGLTLAGTRAGWHSHVLRDARPTSWVDTRKSRRQPPPSMKPTIQEPRLPTRTSSCNCGQLSVTYDGPDPERITRAMAASDLPIERHE